MTLASSSKVNSAGFPLVHPTAQATVPTDLGLMGRLRVSTRPCQPRHFAKVEGKVDDKVNIEVCDMYVPTSPST